MNKISLIHSLIKVSSEIQTYLVNYLEFHKSEPREIKKENYLKLSPRPEKREELPKPFQKEDTSAHHYTILLKIAEEQGNLIKPVNRRVHPLRTKAKCCRKCKAPPEYLKNHGFYRPKKSGRVYPRHTCKICNAEYAPGAGRHKPKHICPYCGYALNPKTYRKNFVVYFCERDDCPHRQVHEKGNRYSEKDWLFDYETLSCKLPSGKKKLERIKNKNLLDIEMTLYVECGMSTREVVKVMQKLYGAEIVKSHQIVLNHAEALANHLSLNEDLLPVPVSDKICEDETYLRYFGRWGYLFRAYNPETKGIIEEYFSEHRDTKGCITLNKGVVEKYLKNCRDPEFDLISDRAPIYEAMRKYFKKNEKAKIDLYQIKGIFDEPDEKNAQFRSEKQCIERSFESLKSATKRRRNFGSFRGAQIFCFLHKIYYNHLRRHSALENMPPVPLYLHSGKMVTNWNELLQFISEKQT
ncbi:DDE-type integrase/transposase/recombinase [Candidatus Peregrinibacteria bacterium]|nr:DDE-type integrase/transposase/recombinase [Candidatus Peregrinibacteria bacterium]